MYDGCEVQRFLYFPRESPVSSSQAVTAIPPVPLSLVFPAHTPLFCPPIFAHFLCPSRKVGLHVEASGGGLDCSERNSCETNTPFFCFVDTCQTELVCVLRLSWSLSSILLDFLPGRAGRGAGERGKKGGWGGRKPPSCHNTAPQILLCFDANVSDSPWFILKCGGRGGRRLWELLSFEATVWL